MCHVCRNVGASIECLAPNCSKIYHYTCSKKDKAELLLLHSDITGACCVEHLDDMIQFTKFKMRWPGDISKIKYINKIFGIFPLMSEII